jgi:hypothetical protein
MTGWWVPSSSLTVSTIQSPQTARFRDDAEQGVSAGISGHSFPGFWSLQAFTRLKDHFWRFVSASKNPVPGGGSRAPTPAALAPAIPTFGPRNSDLDTALQLFRI